MLVEEDLNRMPFHSEVSLLPGESSQAKSSSLTVLDGLHAFNKDPPKELTDAAGLGNKTFTDDTIVSRDHSEFLFRKSDYVSDPDFRLGHEQYSLVQTEVQTPPNEISPRGAYHRKDSNENVKLLSSESFRREERDLYDSADLSHLAELVSAKRTQSFLDQAMTDTFTLPSGISKMSEVSGAGVQEGDDLPPSLVHHIGDRPEDDGSSEPEVQDTYL